MTLATRQRRAFTLVELMMVVLVMAIVAATAAPYLTTSAVDRLENVAQFVADDLAYARNLAITHNSQYRCTFDVRNNLYYIEHSGTNTSLNNLPTSSLRGYGDAATRQTTRVGSIPPSAGHVKLHAVGDSSKSPAPVTQLEFRSFGQTTQTIATDIWLVALWSGSSPLYINVTVHPITGLARIGRLTATPPASSILSGS